MVANRVSPYRDYPDTSLGEDLLAEVVHWRARGHSWDETAAKIQWDVNDLKRACRHDPAYKPALKLAESEYWHESQGAGLRKLREQIAGNDPATATRAAKVVLDFMAELDTNKTKVQIERIRAEARIACAQAKGGKPVERKQSQEENEENEENDPRMQRDTPEQARQREANRLRSQQEDAVEWARRNLVVYLWGGCHKFGQRPDETDTPVYLMTDHSAPGGCVHWALTIPLPVPDLNNGPFLKPPGCRPPTYPDVPITNHDTTAPPG